MPWRLLVAGLALLAVGCSQPAPSAAPSPSVTSAPSTPAPSPSAERSPSAVPFPPAAVQDPPACGEALFVHDGERLLLVTCVGQTVGQESEEIYEWDGTTWTLVDGEGPPPLVVTGAAYDSDRGVVVRYGGLPMDSNDCVPETWEWDGVEWTQVATADDPHPTSCDHEKLAHDASDAGILSVGGGDDDTNLNTETWRWDGSDWSLLTSDGPAGRAHHGLVSDAGHAAVFLYGGYDGTQVFDDFWEWDGATWSELDLRGPGARSHHGVAMNTDAELLLFGGATGPSSFATMTADTWLLTDGAWQQLDTDGPSARLSPALGFDPARATWVLYGGFGADGGELNDTWEFDGTAWKCADNCET